MRTRRGCIYAAGRIGESAITILHSTGIGRDVARLNSKLPRKLPLFPASQLRPTVLFHARFIDPRTILPRPPTQTRFRPVALSYAVIVSIVSLLLSPPPFFLSSIREFEIVCIRPPQLVSRTSLSVGKWQRMIEECWRGIRGEKKTVKIRPFPVIAARRFHYEFKY